MVMQKSPLVAGKLDTYFSTALPLAQQIVASISRLIRLRLWPVGRGWLVSWISRETLRSSVFECK
jgi:hypothetical protein